MDLKQILEQYRNGERGMPTYDELVTIADRAQADAKPVAWMYDDSNGPHLSFTPPSRFGSDQLSEMEVTVHALYTRALAATAAESECPRCGLTVSPESCDCAEARAAAQQQAEPNDWTADECVATGTTCAYGPHGRHGETQCKYCGAAPSSGQQAEPGADERAGVAEEQRQRVRDAIAEALGDAYDCMRVWSAWGVGTMTQDDFQLVAEDDARVDEIASAAIGAMSAK
ncbi:hypothetical protein RSW49_22635 [Escherichia coli]|uniref:hypothetical protein n=1 Tax=Escherichia coli TaxID=562 RepID=UPI0028DE5363|nr:hypothetical protein [Escherichia coli]MDT9105750.1 hypothetical protein [Escherichia coli]